MTIWYLAIGIMTIFFIIPIIIFLIFGYKVDKQQHNQAIKDAKNPFQTSI